MTYGGRFCILKSVQVCVVLIYAHGAWVRHSQLGGRKSIVRIWSSWAFMSHQFFVRFALSTSWVPSLLGSATSIGPSIGQSSETAYQRQRPLHPLWSECTAALLLYQMSEAFCGHILRVSICYPLFIPFVPAPCYFECPGADRCNYRSGIL